MFPEILSLFQNIPLYISLLLVFAFIFWAKYFSKKGLIPHTANDLLSIILIFLFFIFGVFGSIFIIIYTLQLYQFGINFDVINKIVAGVTIIIFFMLCVIISIVDNNVRRIFIIIQLLPTLVLFFFSLIVSSAFLIFTYQVKAIFGIIGMTIPYLFLSFIVFILMQVIVSIILHLNWIDYKDYNKLKEFENQYLKKLIKDKFVQRSFLVIIALLLIGALLFSISSAFYPSDEGSYGTKYVIMDDYESNYRPFAYKLYTENYSIILNSGANRIIIPISKRDISMGTKTRGFFNFYVFNNESNLGPPIIYDQIRKWDLAHPFVSYFDIISEDQLKINFNKTVDKSGIHGAIIRGAVIENISDKYWKPNYGWGDTWSNSPDYSIINLYFRINSSLDLPSDDSRNFLFSQDLPPVKGRECLFQDGSLIVSLENSSIRCDRPTCSDTSCDTRCLDWRIRVYKDQGQFLLDSYNFDATNGEMNIRTSLACEPKSS